MLPFSFPIAVIAKSHRLTVVVELESSDLRSAFQERELLPPSSVFLWNIHHGIFSGDLCLRVKRALNSTILPPERVCLLFDNSSSEHLRRPSIFLSNIHHGSFSAVLSLTIKRALDPTTIPPERVRLLLDNSSSELLHRP